MSTNLVDQKSFYTSLLASPTHKMSAKQRRHAWRVREKAVVSTREPKDRAKKLAEKVVSLSVAMLVRFLKKSARRAATAKHRLADLHESSSFRPALLKEQTYQLAAFVCAKKELDFRIRSLLRPID